MKSLTIKARLIFVLVFLSVLLIAIGALGLRGMAQSNAGLETVYLDRLIPAGQLSEIEELLRDAVIQLNLAAMHDPRLEEHVLHDHPPTLHTDRVFKDIDRVGEIWDVYMQTYLTPEEAGLAEEFADLNTRLEREGLRPAVEMYLAADFSEANMHMIRVTNPLFHEVSAVADRLMNLQMEVGAQEFKTAESAFDSTRTLAMAAIMVGVLIAAFMGWMLLRAIVGPLNRTVGYFDRIAEGNLNNDIVISSHDEVGRLLTGLERMQTRLRGLVGQITASVDAINTGAGEIAKGNADLSQRTEEQASSLEETASSMEELTSTVKQNADNARQADQLATATRDVAAQGGEKAGAAMKSMNEITASAEKIAEIITVIDGIAFQTNILALNAAVEAARAGEQGRGFAVVAGEVRNLAQRSATAAKEIKALLAEDAQTVEKGSKLVLEAGQTMEDIVNHVKRVSDLIGEISAASDEQSSGIEQVNTAVTQMDEVTQQNAALVEEAAAAAESLEEQAQELMQAVSMFRVEEASAFRAADNSGAGRPKQASGDTPPRQPEASSLVHSGPGKPRAAKKAAPLPAPKAGARRGTDDEWEEF